MGHVILWLSFLFYFTLFMWGSVGVTGWVVLCSFIQQNCVAEKQKFKVLFSTHFEQEARTYTLDGILAMKQLVVFCNSQTYRKKEGSLNILPTVKNLDYYSVSSCWVTWSMVMEATRRPELVTWADEITSPPMTQMVAWTLCSHEFFLSPVGLYYNLGMPRLGNPNLPKWLFQLLSNSLNSQVSP